MATFNDARIRPLNDRKPNADGDMVVYWMQAARRFDRNHAIDYALHLARKTKKPLVVYEGLRIDYPWASVRHHQFFLEGFRDHLRIAKERGIAYWPYVETPDRPAKGLLQKVAKNAVAVITDDYPTYIVPYQSATLAKSADCAVIAVDNNGMVPLSLLGASISAAAHLRPRIHKLFAEAWQHRAAAEPDFADLPKAQLEPPFEPFRMPDDLPKWLSELPIDQSVKAARNGGGPIAAQNVFRTFLTTKFKDYAEARNQPDDPDDNAASGLSPYLRSGHLAIQQVVEGVLGDDWTPERLDPAQRGKREGFYGDDANVNSFLDEAITWRDAGYQWWHHRTVNGVKPLAPPKDWPHPQFCDLETSLPNWAKETLKKHETDVREHLYSLEELEIGDTHDELWNAAQRELVTTGKIHNYLRMLWGKKVLQWSKTPAEAYRVLEHLNNKYAVDGRDPNSYTGILWVFGLFDRPWGPERKVFGTVRYMTSENTAKKYQLKGYYAYIHGLPGLKGASVPKKGELF